MVLLFYSAHSFLWIKRKKHYLETQWSFLPILLIVAKHDSISHNRREAFILRKSSRGAWPASSVFFMCVPRLWSSLGGKDSEIKSAGKSGVAKQVRGTSPRIWEAERVAGRRSHAGSASAQTGLLCSRPSHNLKVQLWENMLFFSSDVMILFKIW